MGNKTVFKLTAKSASKKNPGMTPALYAGKPQGPAPSRTAEMASGPKSKPSSLHDHPVKPAPEVIELIASYAFKPSSPLVREPGASEARLASRLVAVAASQGPDVNALCETYSLKREELGRLTGFSLRALADWAAGSLPSQPAVRRLHEIRRLLDALSTIVKRERIPNWLRQANPAFGGLTPLQVIEVGEMDRLWAMVHDLGSGQPD